MSSSVGERWTLWQSGIASIQAAWAGKETCEDAGMRWRLGEGGVVATGAADQRAAGAAAAGGEQVAVAFAVEEGRTGAAADQAVGTIAAVELVGAEAALDQVVLVAAVDRVVAEAAGDAHVLRPVERAFDREAVVAGAEVGDQPAGGAFARAGRLHGADPRAARAEGDALLGGDAEGRAGFVEGDREVIVTTAADQLQAAAAAGDRDRARRKRRRSASLPPAGGGVALGAVAAVAALAAEQFVLAATAANHVVAGTAVDHVGLAVADEDVVEGRAFEALEAEKTIVAVAPALCAWRG